MPILLVITVLLPLAGALALGLQPRLDHRQARLAALGVSLATLALAAVLLVSFQAGVATPQFAFSEPGPGGQVRYGLGWVQEPDIRFALGLDGLSIGLFGLTALLLITAICSSWESITERAGLHYGLLLALEGGLLGLFASLDVVLFYIFFEFTLLPLFFLIGLYGGPERRRAAVTFFLYTLVGSLLTLVGVIALVVVNYQYGKGHTLTFSIPELTRNLADPGYLDWPAWWGAHRWGEWGAFSPFSAASWQALLAFLARPQILIFLLLLAGFAIKVPMFPFHTWLPLAHVEAPTAGSILLAGVLLKLGGYGMIRFNLGMTPLGAQALYPLLIALSVAGILYGALTALAQSDIKRLVAYSSVSHMGFITLGLFALNGTGLEGATIQMINHGLTTGALFACVGILYERYHTREMGAMGGLWDRMPLFAFFLIVVSLGSAALPGLNGFVGEFPILAGAFARDRTATVLASVGMILGAYYLMDMLRKVVFGPLKEPGHDGESHHDHGHGSAVRPIGWHEIAGLAPLLVLILAIGVYPGPIFRAMRPTTREIAARIEPAPPAAARPIVRPASAETTTRTASSAQDRAR